MFARHVVPSSSLSSPSLSCRVGAALSHVHLGAAAAAAASSACRSTSALRRQLWSSHRTCSSTPPSPLPTADSATGRLTLRDLYSWQERVHALALTPHLHRRQAQLDHLLHASTAYLVRHIPRIFRTACAHATDPTHPRGNDLAELERMRASSPTLSTLLAQWQRFGNDSHEWSAPSLSTDFASRLATSEDLLRTVTHELRDALYAASDMTVKDTLELRTSPAALSLSPSSLFTHAHGLQHAMHRILVPLYSAMVELRTMGAHYAYGTRVRELVARPSSAPLEPLERALDDLRYSHALVAPCHVPSVVLATVDSAHALCVEKHGDAPDVEVFIVVPSSSPSSSPAPPTSGLSPLEQRATFLAPSQWSSSADGLCALVVEAHVHFVVMEVLKNSMKAVIDRYGILNVRDAPPIRCVVSSSGGSATGGGVPNGVIGIRIDDTGIGIPPPAGATRVSPSPAHIFDFFTSSSPPPILESGYTYSRRFGASFTGLGVGLPLCRLHLRQLLGGDMAIACMPGLSTSTFLTFARDGQAQVGAQQVISEEEEGDEEYRHAPPPPPPSR